MLIWYTSPILIACGVRCTLVIFYACSQIVKFGAYCGYFTLYRGNDNVDDYIKINLSHRAFQYDDSHFVKEIIRWFGFWMVEKSSVYFEDVVVQLSVQVEFPVIGVVNLTEVKCLHARIDGFHWINLHVNNLAYCYVSLWDVK